MVSDAMRQPLWLLSLSFDTILGRHSTYIQDARPPEAALYLWWQRIPGSRRCDTVDSHSHDQASGCPPKGAWLGFGMDSQGQGRGLNLQQSGIMTQSSARSLDKFMLMSPKPTVDMTSEPRCFAAGVSSFYSTLSAASGAPTVMAKYIAVM